MDTPVITPGRAEIMLFLTGGVLIFLARSCAYWWEKNPWLFRISGGLCMLLGVGSTYCSFGPGSGMRALIASAIVGVLLVVQDLWVERAEKALREEQARAWRDARG